MGYPIIEIRPYCESDALIPSSVQVVVKMVHVFNVIIADSIHLRVLQRIADGRYCELIPIELDELYGKRRFSNEDALHVSTP